MTEQFEFTQCALGEDGFLEIARTDLLDGHILFRAHFFGGPIHLHVTNVIHMPLCSGSERLGQAQKWTASVSFQ
jgi:hypothetical protein